MINFMKFKVLYFVLSLVIILPGIFFLVTSGLKPGIDFTGGALLEYRLGQAASTDEIKQKVSSLGVDVSQVTSSGDNTYIIKTKPLDQDKINAIKSALTQGYGSVEERRIENVGPTIGTELRNKALIALAIMSTAIVIYVAYSFRKVPKPASSWRFGITAVVALIHDVLFVIGAFAIFGKLFGAEVDSLFVTALLTIIGFSVHDTIVVFDRIRENLLKNLNKDFNEVANISVVQTLARSLNTSLTVVFVLTAMLLFGGASLHWFIIALLLGIISGTYSSIFNATALLTWWEEKLGH